MLRIVFIGYSTTLKRQYSSGEEKLPSNILGEVYQYLKKAGDNIQSHVFGTGFSAIILENSEALTFK